MGEVDVVILACTYVVKLLLDKVALFMAVVVFEVVVKLESVIFAVVI